MNDGPPESPPPHPRKRAGWLRREGIDLGDAIVQFFSVLLGVLLALLISQWTNHRQQEAKARAALQQQQAAVKEAMQAIHVELAGNRTSLHGSVAQLYAAARRMYAARGKRDQPPRPCYLWDGFGVGRGIFVNLTSAAYQTAIATQAMAQMPFQQAHGVAEVYGAQQVFATGTSMIRNKILAGNPSKLEMCIGWLESLGLTELSLNDAYATLIGPDKTRWPAPPFPLPGMTTKGSSP